MAIGLATAGCEKSDKPEIPRTCFSVRDRIKNATERIDWLTENPGAGKYVRGGRGLARTSWEKEKDCLEKLYSTSSCNDQTNKPIQNDCPR